MKAYEYDNLPGDQRLPHDSGRAVGTEALGKLGVLYYHFADISDVDKLATDRGYKNRDEITVSPEQMGEEYEEKVKIFFNEHLHEDEEIRYIRDGQGFFDVRGRDDDWIRVRLEKDDLLILPAGIYHRFTTDEANVRNIAAPSGVFLPSSPSSFMAVNRAYSSCEDQDEYDLRNQFETNFIGTLHIIHTTLPYFRRQNSGRYLIFSSTSGALGVPGLGPYCATKYAVEGLIEAMLYETDSFNVKATLIEPGLVRRDGEPGDSPLPTWGHFLIKPSSDSYENVNSPALHARRMVQWLGDRQPTSAVKCAEIVWQLAHCSYPPLRLLLGSYAIESIRDRMRSVTEELEDWKHLDFLTEDV
ncbi:RmlC-like jelly roll fold protein [Metarhizium rileyi]|uniref:Acireductone dioxygenase n=1 Tax=Metarhizium rileyi (strain RCEF 4871) TaxID=1649241 RepID=A0A167F862_METRR|nr:RmlC-like jelly roll fold protein [Metarhizium rileyi RCEF 4871]